MIWYLDRRGICTMMHIYFVPKAMRFALYAALYRDVSLHQEQYRFLAIFVSAKQ